VEKRLMGAARYELLLTNPSGTQIIADPIGPADAETRRHGWTGIQVKPRHNEAGYGEFTTAATPAVLDAVYTPDTRVLVRRTDPISRTVSIVMAGPVEQPANGYDVRRDGVDGYGLVTVPFTDDKVWLGYRLAYPNPAQPSTGQTTTARYAINAVNPETAMYALANLNAGPGALAVRRITGLSMAAPVGLLPGAAITASYTRDTVLSDALRDVSRLAGGTGLGFRIVQAGTTGMRFEVFQPTDRSTSVVFSRPMGNLSTINYSQTAPTCTVAIVGDATAGVGRVIKERINTTAQTAGWVRREKFVDGRGAANATELEQTGDDALTDGGPQVRFAFQAIETPQTRYGVDLFAGDLVSAQPYVGGPFTSALVLGADITVTADKGDQVVLVIGSDTDTVVDAKAAEIRRLWRTIGRLQGAL
jgi:hypothetical protein